MKPTTGRRVQCQQPNCVNRNVSWVIRPLPYTEKGKLKSQLHTWPEVFCNECGCIPAFIGYVEDDVFPTDIQSKGPQ